MSLPTLNFQLFRFFICPVYFSARRWIPELQETEIGLLGRMTQQIFFLDISWNMNYEEFYTYIKTKIEPMNIALNKFEL